jgi:hypothetical protein
MVRYASTLTRQAAGAHSSGYTVPCSADFAAGRGGLLQLLGASLSSCCRYYPARVSRRIGQIATLHAAFAPLPRARPLGLTFSRPPVRLLSLRPDNLLPIPRMALSIDFQDSVSFLPTIQATRLLTLASAGLTPAEYTSLSWTYDNGCRFRLRSCRPASYGPLRSCLGVALLDLRLPGYEGSFAGARTPMTFLPS